MLDEQGYSAQRRGSAITFGTKWEAITPHDTNPLPRHYKYVICTADGTCAMIDSAGTSLSLEFTANEILPVIPTIVHTDSTGTFYGVIE